MSFQTPVTTGKRDFPLSSRPSGGVTVTVDLIRLSEGYHTTSKDLLSHPPDGLELGGHLHRRTETRCGLCADPEKSPSALFPTHDDQYHPSTETKGGRVSARTEDGSRDLGIEDVGP